MLEKGRGYRAAATGLGAALGSWALGGLGAAIVVVVFVTEKLDIAGLAGLALLFGLGGVLGMTGAIVSAIALFLARGGGPTKARRYALIGFLLSLPSVAAAAGLLVLAWWAAQAWATHLGAVH